MDGAKIPGKDDANVRQWWLRECCLSPDQWDRTIRKLKKWGLIERRQWWFAGRSILHVRATELTKSFLAASTTWKAASEFLNDLGLNGSGKSADHGSANVLTSNGVSKSAEPGSAKTLNSNYKNILHLKPTKENGTSAHAPLCAQIKQSNLKKTPGEDKKEAGIHKALFAAWASAI